LNDDDLERLVTIAEEMIAAAKDKVKSRTKAWEEAKKHALTLMIHDLNNIKASKPY
jgi:hypothetical protein